MPLMTACIKGFARFKTKTGRKRLRKNGSLNCLKKLANLRTRNTTVFQQEPAQDISPLSLSAPSPSKASLFSVLQLRIHSLLKKLKKGKSRFSNGSRKSSRLCFQLTCLFVQERTLRGRAILRFYTLTPNFQTEARTRFVKSNCVMCRLNSRSSL